jgi:type IV pilus assembly protein PilX
MSMNVKLRYRPVAHQQKGVVLLVSLLFLLLLTLLGVSSMQNATLQEKMASSVTVRNQSFQSAEATLRRGESAIQAPGYKLDACKTDATCAPPTDSKTVTQAGINPAGSSGQPWIATDDGLYLIQRVGQTMDLRNFPMCTSKSTTLYRITAVSIQGVSRTVLESIYANC